MSERFYINLPLTPGPFTLDGPEAHHLATVCRLRPGAEVCLFNGDGHEYPARITFAERRAVSLEILSISTPERELQYPLEVAAPLPKGDRCQFLIEKLTEIGVSRFVPLACRRSVIHPREGKQGKLERYVVEACKQCGRNVLMEIAALTAWNEHLASRRDGDHCVVAHPTTTTATDLSTLRGSAVRIAVGPEGGFTEEEVALAAERGWQTVNLGPRILRIETAAVVLAARASMLE